MPSFLHQVLVEVFRARPSLAGEYLSTLFGFAVPEHDLVQAESSDLSDYRPTEYRADMVLVMRDADKRPVLAVVLEVQLRPDSDKHWIWAEYLASLGARLRCPVVLLVVSPSGAAAAWCTNPIASGHPDHVLRPLVLGPDQLAPVTDLEQARQDPERALIAALANRNHPDIDTIFSTLLTALHETRHPDATLYTDVLLMSLPPRIRQRLEGSMTTFAYEYQSNFARRYFTEGEASGRAEGEAQAVLAVLRARGIPVPNDARTRISTCTDLDQLDTWIQRAATATTIHDVLNP